MSAPILLVGVTLDRTFYPNSAGEAGGRLELTKGLVALAPLSSVSAADAVDAAVVANADARDAWAGLAVGAGERSVQ